MVDPHPYINWTTSGGRAGTAQGMGCLLGDSGVGVSITGARGLVSGVSLVWSVGKG